MAKSKDYAKILSHQITSDPDFAEDMEREHLNGLLAVLIYSERKKAKLSQKKLADRAGTHQSVIARLENADYDGRSIESLRKVLYALGRRLIVSVEPLVSESAETYTLAGPFSPLKVWRPEVAYLPAETQAESAAIG
jgi:transcriptional regulator with XRE-family HTH domain